MKKKVIEFIGMLSDGGAETLAVNYALLMDKSKFDVVILTVYPVQKTANLERVQKNGIRVISIYEKNNMYNKIMWHTFSEVQIPRRLSKILKAEKPDVLHVHLQLLNYVQRIASQIKDIALIYTCHNEPERMLAGNRENEGKAADYLIKNNSMRMVALHDDMREALNNMFGIHNTIVIRNGIDFNKFLNMHDNRANKRKELGIPEDAFVVGHIGRFIHQKNHEFLVKVFAEVEKRNEKAFLLMIGSGELQAKIKDQISQLNLNEKTRILSHRTDIPELLQAMDVFVFPSHFEGLSVTLVEAQVAGTRCVISNAINKETILSRNVIDLDINLAPDIWANYIMNDKIERTEYGDINFFDLNKEIRRLEMLYEGKL